MTTDPRPSRRALVTGGASGIGAAVARRLAFDGFDGFDVVVADLSATTDHTSVIMDVSDPAAWEALMAEHGPFDLAFLNAGVSTRSGGDVSLDITGPTLADLTDAQYRRIMGANVDGVVFGARAILPGMVERGAGDIVCTASMAGLVPMPMDPIYGLTKHAVVGLVRALGAATEGTGVHVSAFCPGFIETPLVGTEGAATLRDMGVPVMDVETAADAVVHALEQRSGVSAVGAVGRPATPRVPVEPTDLRARPR